MSAAQSESKPPPRRAIPGPPSSRSTHLVPAPNKSGSQTQQVLDLAACFTKISTTTNAPDKRAQILARVPPPVPPRGVTRPVPSSNETDSGPASAQPSSTEMSKLLARQPPPPPSRRASSIAVGTKPLYSPTIPISLPPSPRPPPVLPRRAQTQIIPPVLNLASKPVVLRKDVVQMDPPSSCIQCRDFTAPDAHAASFPRHSVHSLEELAHDLTEPFEYDVDKARAIFTWLHFNVSYDAVSFLSGNRQPQTPESVLLSGLAVCEGYAALFECLADIIGLQAHKVSGHGKGYGYQPVKDGDPAPAMQNNHAWNCVLFNQEWHLIDACWGAGVLNGTVYEPRFAPQWFISSPIEFARRHYPEDPSFQLTPEQLTWDEYILAPEGPVLTSDFLKFDLHPLLVEPSTKMILEKRFTKFSVSTRCEHISTAEADNYVFVISATDKNLTALDFDEQEGVWSTTIFTPRDGTVNLYAVDTVNKKDAKGLGVSGYNQAKGRKAMSFKGLASWSVIHL